MSSPSLFLTQQGRRAADRKQVITRPFYLPAHGSGISKGFRPFTVAGAAKASTLFPLSFVGAPTKNLERVKATQPMAAGQSRLTDGGQHDELRRRTTRALLMMPSPTHNRPATAIQVVAGLGCRRGCSLEDLSTLLIDSLQAQGLTVDNLVGLTSIAHKRNEPGLLALTERLGLTLTCFSPEELLPYQTRVQACALILAATGSPAVAEPCALALAERLCGDSARLLGSKTRNASATCALVSISAKDIA